MIVKPCFAENAMVCEDNGANVKYHPVCPKCHKVWHNVTGSGHCSNGTAMVGYSTCYHCNVSFPVMLHRG